MPRPRKRLHPEADPKLDAMVNASRRESLAGACERGPAGCLRERFVVVGALLVIPRRMLASIWLAQGGL